jgi:hypothetical protein
VSEPSLDWAVLELEGVGRAVERAARSVATSPTYGQFFDMDDLHQEARILAVKHAGAVRAYVCDGELGRLEHALHMDLIDMVRPRVARAVRHQSYEARYLEGESDSKLRANTATCGGGAYTADLVASLMPAVFDDSFAYGMQAETAPDGDMPRAKSNPATGNTLAAHIADIRTGWKRAPLAHPQRVVLLLTHGLGWRQEEVAFNQGVSQQAISHRLITSHQLIADTLNGRKADA